MKTLILTLAITLGGLAHAQDFSSPQATFNTVLTAIQNQDLDLYRQCWAEESLEEEGQYSELEKNAELWKELAGIFKGPQTLEETEPSEGATKFTTTIIAPEAEGGGIGAITLILVEGTWKMYRW